MTDTELKTILENHKKWLIGEVGGRRADLSGVDLAWVNLRGVDLCKANMREVSISLYCKKINLYICLNY